MENEWIKNTLLRLETKIDKVVEDVGSLKESRAETKGMGNAVKFVMGTSVISGIISYFSNMVHHP